MTSTTVITFLLLALSRQGFGEPMVGSQAGASSSASASASVTQSVIVATDNGVAIDSTYPVSQLRDTEFNLQQLYSQQTALFQQNQAKLNQFLTTLNIPGDTLPNFLRQQLSLAQSYISQSQSFIEGANNLLVVLENLGGNNVRTEWLQEVISLQTLAGLAIQRSAETFASLERAISITITENNAFTEAKIQQLNNTKQLMDDILAQLEVETRKVGQEAIGIIQQCFNEVKVAIRSTAQPGQGDNVIRGLENDMNIVVADLSMLRPEDVAPTIEDAHRFMDDCKAEMVKLRIPSSVVRKSVTKYQSKVFAIMAKAQNIHSLVMDRLESQE